MTRRQTGASDKREHNQAWISPDRILIETSSVTPSQLRVRQAARSVMHPDRHDLEWTYYLGRMGG